MYVACRLLPPREYRYLYEVSGGGATTSANAIVCLKKVEETTTERFEFERLKTSMQSVGFGPRTQQQIFGIISAVLLLGNIEFIKVSCTRARRARVFCLIVDARLHAFSSAPAITATKTPTLAMRS